jgi:hypothetical protein
MYYVYGLSSKVEGAGNREVLGSLSVFVSNSFAFFAFSSASLAIIVSQLSLLEAFVIVGFPAVLFSSLVVVPTVDSYLCSSASVLSTTKGLVIEADESLLELISLVRS